MTSTSADSLGPWMLDAQSSLSIGINLGALAKISRFAIFLFCFCRTEFFISPGICLIAFLENEWKYHFGTRTASRSPEKPQMKFKNVLKQWKECWDSSVMRAIYEAYNSINAKCFFASLIKSRLVRGEPWRSRRGGSWKSFCDQISACRLRSHWHALKSLIIAAEQHRCSRPPPPIDRLLPFQLSLVTSTTQRRRKEKFSKESERKRGEESK